jgi:hypothetical protein
MLKRLGMMNHNAVKTPWRHNFELPKTWEPLSEKRSWYATRTGAINWVATGTRGDISYTASRLSEANAGPSSQHIEALTHLFHTRCGWSGPSRCLRPASLPNKPGWQATSG